MTPRTATVTVGGALSANLMWYQTVYGRRYGSEVNNPESPLELVISTLLPIIYTLYSEICLVR